MSNGRTVFLLDPTGQTLVDTADIDGGIYHVASCGVGAALVTHTLDTTGRTAAAGRSKNHFTYIQSERTSPS